MEKTYFTDTFRIISIPKPVKKKKKYGWNSTIPLSKRKKNLTKRLKMGKKGHRKLPSIKSLKTKADRLFSLFIRTRDKYTCVLCGSKENIQCGHLVKRGKMSVRFDEVNCHALCSGCNYKDNFEHDHYVIWFIDKYGVKQYRALLDRSSGMVKANRIFFEEIIKKYT